MKLPISYNPVYTQEERNRLRSIEGARLPDGNYDGIITDIRVCKRRPYDKCDRVCVVVTIPVGAPAYYTVAIRTIYLNDSPTQRAVMLRLHELTGSDVADADKYHGDYHDSEERWEAMIDHAVSVWVRSYEYGGRQYVNQIYAFNPTTENEDDLRIRTLQSQVIGMGLVNIDKATYEPWEDYCDPEMSPDEQFRTLSQKNADAIREEKAEEEQKEIDRIMEDFDRQRQKELSTLIPPGKDYTLPLEEREKRYREWIRRKREEKRRVVNESVQYVKEQRENRDSGSDDDGFWDDVASVQEGGE